MAPVFPALLQRQCKPGPFSLFSCYRTVPYPVNQKVTKTLITCLVKLPPKFIIPDPALLV